MRRFTHVYNLKHIYYESLEHIDIVLAVRDPDDMCYKKWENYSYIPQSKVKSADRGISP